MYLLTHSLSPVLVLVAVMDPKVLKTKISHTHSLILSSHYSSLSASLVITLLSLLVYPSLNVSLLLFCLHSSLSGASSCVVQAKKDMLYDMMVELMGGGQTLVFVQSRKDIDWLKQQLGAKGMEVDAHHGKLDVNEQIEVKSRLSISALKACPFKAFELTLSHCLVH